MFSEAPDLLPGIDVAKPAYHSSAIAKSYERRCTPTSAAVLMRRPTYHDVTSFYQLDDTPLHCTATGDGVAIGDRHHFHRHQQYPADVYDRGGVVEPSYLYNVASAAAYDFGNCPVCCEGSLSEAKSSSADDEAASPGRRSSRKRSLSQAELERRRSLANHQERRRMHRLNSALDRLRCAIPSKLQNGNNRRLSKIKTLKMAINYIGELQTVLGAGACWD